MAPSRRARSRIQRDEIEPTMRMRRPRTSYMPNVPTHVPSTARPSAPSAHPTTLKTTLKSTKQPTSQMDEPDTTTTRRMMSSLCHRLHHDRRVFSKHRNRRLYLRHRTSRLFLKEMKKRIRTKNRRTSSAVGLASRTGLVLKSDKR